MTDFDVEELRRECELTILLHRRRWFSDHCRVCDGPWNIRRRRGFWLLRPFSRRGTGWADLRPGCFAVRHAWSALGEIERMGRR